jgi:hypothetical protein
VDRVMAEVHQLGGATVAVDRATPKDEGPGGKGMGGGGGRGRGSHGAGGGRGYGGAVVVNGRGYGGAMGFNGVSQAAFHGGGGGYGGYGVGAPGGPFNGCVSRSALSANVWLRQLVSSISANLVARGSLALSTHSPLAHSLAPHARHLVHGFVLQSRVLNTSVSIASQVRRGDAGPVRRARRAVHADGPVPAGQSDTRSQTPRLRCS